jgi:4-hydroxybenzoate polyprenyltransferase
MILEYLKLARISIASITGLAPVMGALATGQYQILNLVLLFLIGFFGHAYGMTVNDLSDYTIDKKSSEITDRPLVSGTISKQQAVVFAILNLFIMFLLAFVIVILTMQYLPFFMLFIPVLCVTIYNIISKKIPFADVLLAISMFFFILYGALTQQVSIDNLPLLVWIICLLGTIQMLSINIILGGFKDAENDMAQGAKTGVVFFGLNIKNNKIFIPKSFVVFVYTLQLLNIFIAYLPFFIIPDFIPWLPLRYFAIGFISVIGIFTIYISHIYLTTRYFERGKLRMLFNLQGFVNFIFAPILLLNITPFSLLIILIPAIGFYISTLLFNEKFMQPASM